MDSPSRAGSHLVHDPCLYPMDPMDPMEMSCFDIRASAIPAPKRSMDSRATKRKALTSAPPRISLARYTNNQSSWITTASALNRSRLQPKKDSSSQLELQMHQSTCLDLNADSNSTESDLWILPDFDDWEVDNETQQDCQHAKEGGTWAPLVKRAVNSNHERLRRRLEGDGWDFVGGKYGDDGTALKEEADASAESEDSVDKEFDVVVLPVVHVSC